MNEEKFQLTLIPNPLKIEKMITSWGFANGYVGLPLDHPWAKTKDNYDLPPIVHGGVTWCDDHLPDTHSDSKHFWIGFDTRHWEDNPNTCTNMYCYIQLFSLYQQALDAYNNQHS